MGVSIRWGAECTGFRQSDSGAIKSVITTDGELYADHFVNAAGPWAARIAGMAGVELPVVPVRRQAAVTEPCPQIPSTMPMTIFLDNSFHARIRDGRALLCWPNPETPGEPDQLRADPEWIDTVRKMADERMPALRDVRIDRSLCYAGLYEVSPDEHAIVGTPPECENLYLANGSSGHGVMHSPVLGAIVADLIVGRAPEIDIDILRPSRFREGAAIKSVELI
jgi:sarcosine oxidase subunit beta